MGIRGLRWGIRGRGAYDFFGYLKGYSLARRHYKILGTNGCLGGYYIDKISFLLLVRLIYQTCWTRFFSFFVTKGGQEWYLWERMGWE
jgi:hypothetical protein